MSLFLKKVISQTKGMQKIVNKSNKTFSVKNFIMCHEST